MKWQIIFVNYLLVIIFTTWSYTQVLITYEIVTDYDLHTAIKPDSITLNNQPVTSSCYFNAGTYTLKICKAGYHSIEKEIKIESNPNGQPYVIKEMFVSFVRIDIIAISDTNERIEPEQMTLNNMDVTGNLFRPGIYTLDVSATGYHPVHQKVTIPAGGDVYEIFVTLPTKSRQLKFSFTYDIPPIDVTPPQVTCMQLYYPKSEKQIQDGDELRPDSYHFKAEKAGYRLFEKRCDIWPADSTMPINFSMIALPVRIQVYIIYDVPPLTNTEPNIIWVDKFGAGVAMTINNGYKMPPGTYLLNIWQSGYDFGPYREIEILPSEYPYNISFIGKAQPRRLLFNINNPDAVRTIEIKEAKPNGKSLSISDLFEPGKNFDLTIKFNKYQTFYQRIRIPPGIGPYIIDVPLSEYEDYNFCTKNKTEIIDNITYEYEFFIDATKIEAQQIDTYPNIKHTDFNIGCNYFSVQTDTNSQVLRVYAGYFYVTYLLSDLRSNRFILDENPTSPELGGGKFTNICGERLIAHLQKRLAMETSNDIPANNAVVVRIMEQIIRNHRMRLAQCDRAEKNTIIEYLENLSVTPDYHIRIQQIIEKLK